MKALLIDPITETVKDILCPSEHVGRALWLDWMVRNVFHGPKPQLELRNLADNANAIVLDSNAFFHPQPVNNFFLIDGYSELVVGPALLFGTNLSGMLIDVTLGHQQLIQHITWMKPAIGSIQQIIDSRREN